MADGEHHPISNGAPEKKFRFVYFERGFCIVRIVTGLQKCLAEVTELFSIAIKVFSFNAFCSLGGCLVKRVKGFWSFGVFLVLGF